MLEIMQDCVDHPSSDMLRLACFYGSEKCVKAIVDRWPQIEYVDSMFEAIRQRNTACVETMVGAGFSPAMVPNAVDQAVRNSDGAMLQLLFREGGRLPTVVKPLFDIPVVMHILLTQGYRPDEDTWDYLWRHRRMLCIAELLAAGYSCPFDLPQPYVDRIELLKLHSLKSPEPEETNRVLMRHIRKFPRDPASIGRARAILGDCPPWYACSVFLRLKWSPCSHRDFLPHEQTRVLFLMWLSKKLGIPNDIMINVIAMDLAF